ncbi:hypothetical protein RC083_15545 [Pseudoalteromonas haloplanktis]|uniref:Uncharacterized protein n=1 Tax=Pseudoalteromonas haloplanktis TaxID=228 RepID=A0ABU1BEZ6_PSEHA|nr:MULTISPECIES: hypothetical protein [Pseudoalteromonas]MDQ9092995.1 hypothetical protein [Pseudoalteromonas haloplanktis]BDF95025.1 hypothetical protein KAN5_18630 [Pseudoalteromonas sp. KAN5]
MDYERQLLDILTLLNNKVSEGDAEKANTLHAQLNEYLIQWCESDSPPSQTQLKSVQKHIADITKSAESARNEVQKSLLEQRKSKQAISKYKSTKP